MRKTWNSWTYYGDRDSGRSDKGAHRQESVCQESWKMDKRASREGTRGSVEDAYEHAFEQSMADALERAMDLSDVRQERVARIRRAIQAGNYWVAAEDVARKLVRNMLGDYS